MRRSANGTVASGKAAKSLPGHHRNQRRQDVGQARCHVLTSLAGFEALLRGLEVWCHGLPFYAGWGLTHDVLSTPRRTRRLTLDELVAGALIAYPTYVHPGSGRFTTAEGALSSLSAWRAGGPRLPWWRKRLRRILALLKRA